MKEKLLRPSPLLIALLPSLFGVCLIFLAETPPYTLLLASIWSPVALFDMFRYRVHSADFMKGSPQQLFFVGFLVVFVIRQLFVNDALIPVGAAFNEQRQQFGGGPLGEPNFESIAIACIGGMSFL